MPEDDPTTAIQIRQTRPVPDEASDRDRTVDHEEDDRCRTHPYIP